MKVVISSHYQKYAPFLLGLPECFDREGEILYEGRNTVKRFRTDDGCPLVVKRYKVPNLIQRMAYTFWRKSKAERAYLYAFRLQGLGIDTPDGIAYFERKGGLLFRDGYFVAAECGHPSVLSRLYYEENFGKEEEVFIDRLAFFFAQLHRKGVLHGDLNLANILYREAPGNGSLSFCVIDTNRSRFKRHLARRECLKNLMRVTHRRDLLELIIAHYARIRKWDPVECVNTVMDILRAFERRKEMKNRFRKFFSCRV